MPRFRVPILAALCGTLAAPAAAPAMLTDIGTQAPPATPSCPERPCLVISRTTGYQAKVGEQRGLMTVPRSGRLVSWTISLSKPDARQIRYFRRNLGGEPTARIAILRPGRKLHSRLVAQSPPMRLTRYLGKTVEFPLERTLRVQKGWIVALSVPSWAPALAVNLGGDTSWRASRRRGQCEDFQTQTAQRDNQIGQYYCLYRTARLAYSARVISTP